MSDIITAKIDVMKIEKARLYQSKAGTYLDFTLIRTKDNQYGNDYMIVQQVSKEEREAGIKGAILGNAKILVRQDRDAQAQAQSEFSPEEVAAGDGGEDSFPF